MAYRSFVVRALGGQPCDMGERSHYAAASGVACGDQHYLLVDRHAPDRVFYLRGDDTNPADPFAWAVDIFRGYLHCRLRAKRNDGPLFPNNRASDGAACGDPRDRLGFDALGNSLVAVVDPRHACEVRRSIELRIQGADGRSLRRRARHGAVRPARTQSPSKRRKTILFEMI